MKRHTLYSKPVHKPPATIQRHTIRQGGRLIWSRLFTPPRLLTTRSPASFALTRFWS